MPENTDWIAAGAGVAEYTYGMPAAVSIAAVERLTATQIILSNGKRYRRDTLRPVGDSKRDAWSARTELRPVDDPRVRDALALNQLRNVIRTVDDLIRDHKGTVDGVLATLAAIEQAVAKARAAITE